MKIGDKIMRIRLILTSGALLFLIGAFVVIYVSSPDFSETVAEYVMSLSEEKGIHVDRNIGYTTPSDGSRTGDLYIATTVAPAGGRPAVVIVHGGSWSQGSKGEFQEVSTARYFARNGYAALSIDYRLLPRQGEFPADIIDVKEAVCFLIANAEKYGINPKRVFVIGTSSGASAAMIAAYTAGNSEFKPASEAPCAIKAVASISGPTDFVRESKNPYVQEYLHSKGKVPEEKVLQDASPIAYAATAVPTILLHGTDDKNVEFAQVQELERALREHRVPVSLVRIEGQGHFIGASSRRQGLAFVLKFFSQIP